MRTISRGAARFPTLSRGPRRNHIQTAGEMERHCLRQGMLAQGRDAFKKSEGRAGRAEGCSNCVTAIRDWRLSLSQSWIVSSAANEAVKSALAQSVYFHDDPADAVVGLFAMARGRYLLSGGRFVHGTGRNGLYQRARPRRTGAGGSM